METTSQRHMRFCEFESWECELLTGCSDLHPPTVEHRTVAVFFDDGESVVFEEVRSESIEFCNPDNERMLTMVMRGGREVNVPAVRYWTEDAR